jgi:hypothetical protein
MGESDGVFGDQKIKVTIFVNLIHARAAKSKDLSLSQQLSGEFSTVRVFIIASELRPVSSTT